MIRTTPALRLGVAIGLAVALSGCVSLLPKTKPATLYRFGQTPAAAEAPAGQGAPVGVFKAGGLFQREAAGDRLMTVADNRVAYIADARWAAPAQVMFDQAVLAAFDANAGQVKLVSRGEPVAAKFILRLDVRNFETRYDHGPKAAPQVLVRVRASLVTAADHTQAPEQMFEASVRAGGNRVGAIVPAYDAAVAEVLKQVIAWTNSAVATPAKG